MLASTFGFLLLASLAGGGAAPRTLRAAVRVSSPGDWAVSTRIRGQTSDLGIDVTEVPTASLEPRRQDQIAAADLLTRQLAVDVAVWFTPAELFVYAASPAPGYLLVRPKPAHDGPQASGRLEEVALIVRQALKAIKDGGVVGVPRPGTEREQASASRPAPVLPPQVDPAGLAVRVDLGERQLFDGIGSVPGLVLQVGLAWDRWSAGLVGQAYLSRTLRTGTEEVLVSRRAVGVGLDRQLATTGAFRVLVGATAGRTWAVLGDSNFYRGPSSFGSWTVGVHAGLRFPMLSVKGVRLEFFTAAACDYLATPPTIDLASGAATLRVWHLSAFQPSVTLGVEIRGG